MDGDAGAKGGSCLRAEFREEQKVERQDLLKLASFRLPVSLPWFPGSLLPFHFTFVFFFHIDVCLVCAQVCMWDYIYAAACEDQR